MYHRDARVCTAHDFALRRFVRWNTQRATHSARKVPAMRSSKGWQQQPLEDPSVGVEVGESKTIARPSPIPTTIGGSEPLSTSAMSQLLRCRESIRSFDLLTAREC